VAWVEGIESFEDGGEPRSVGAALGEFAARRLAVTLIRTGGVEVDVATGARNAATKRAHALSDRIGDCLRQRCVGRW